MDYPMNSLDGASIHIYNNFITSSNELSSGLPMETCLNFTFRWRIHQIHQFRMRADQHLQTHHRTEIVSGIPIMLTRFPLALAPD